MGAGEYKVNFSLFRGHSQEWPEIKATVWFKRGWGPSTSKKHHDVMGIVLDLESNSSSRCRVTLNTPVSPS